MYESKVSISCCIMYNNILSMPYISVYYYYKLLGGCLFYVFSHQPRREHNGFFFFNMMKLKFKCFSISYIFVPGS